MRLRERRVIDGRWNSWKRSSGCVRNTRSNNLHFPSRNRQQRVRILTTRLDATWKDRTHLKLHQAASPTGLFAARDSKLVLLILLLS